MRPWKRPQEKGIDTSLALDVIEFVVRDACDVAIIVSRDRDLFEIPKTLDHLRPLTKRPLRVEAAVPVGAHERGPVTLKGFHYTHQISPEVFALVRDDTNYAASDTEREAPRHPASLEEHLRVIGEAPARADAPPQ